jgi:uncharacterized repeat protein (TIGR01451 family)
MNILTKNKKQLMVTCMRLFLGLLCTIAGLGLNNLHAQCTPDIISPVILCPANITTSVPAGTCNAVVAVPDPVYSDNCPETVTVTSGTVLTDPFPLGTNNVFFTATDAAGNTATCSTVIYVNGGVSPPVCNDQDTVYADPSGMTVYNPADLLEGGPYNCSQILGSLTFNGAPEPTVTINGTGSVLVYVSVSAPNGIWNKCWGNVVVLPSQSGGCNPDVVPPVCTAPADITISGEAYAALNINLQNLPQINAAFGSATYSDNCSPTNSTLLEANSMLTYAGGAPKTLTRSFIVFDLAGNSSQVAIQLIHIGQISEFVHIPGWFYPGDAEVDTLDYTSPTMIKTYSDLVFDAACNGETSKIERTWSVLDWAAPAGDNVELPALDIDGDGQTGDAYEVTIVNDSIWRLENGIPVAALAKATNLFTYVQVIRFNYLDTATQYVVGNVFLDTLSNCTLDSGEPVLAGWKVKGLGQSTNRIYTAVTDATGAYSLAVCTDDALVEVSLDVPYNYAGACPSTHLALLSPGAPVTVDFPVVLSDSCNVLGVDIATASLRPCFNSSYAVNYFNYSAATVAGTYVEVELDSLVNYLSSSIPGVLQTGNTYRFITGDLAPGASGQFSIAVLLNCDAPLGATHCTSAHIFPVDSCGWEGPVLKASADCTGDSVHLRITNIGSADMIQSAEFVVSEDLIMYMMAPFQLTSGSTREVSLASNNATWRIEAPQVPGNPWGGTTAAAIEGCPELGTPGIVNIFAVNDPNPFTSTDCTQNTSSFDPNDKQGFPVGYGNQHFIRENTDVEYMIRFQNTGTDTAFNVVLLDTLSPFLDIATVRPGASDHQYDFDILEGNVLRFMYNNILLPDSNVNEVASHGFVKFRVAQMPGNPLGTVINNSAAILFDFNGPVITNTTWHTIGKDFMEVNAVNPGAGFGKLLVYPNPAASSFYIEMPEENQHAIFELQNYLGQSVANRSFSGKQFRFAQENLPAGIYTFWVTGDNGAVFTGKIKLTGK